MVRIEIPQDGTQYGQMGQVLVPADKFLGGNDSDDHEPNLLSLERTEEGSERM